VIITDIVSSWKAKQAWSKDSLMERFGKQKFKTDEVNYQGKGKLFMMLNDYFLYSQLNEDEDPIYLFDDQFPERDLVKDLVHDYEIPLYFQEDYLSVLEDERPPYRWLVFGPSRTGSPFHLDPYQTSAWNALLSGRKRWILYPHDDFPPGVDIDWDDDGNFDSDAPEPVKWFLDIYPYIPRNKQPLECILEEGELIFIPCGWWHMVLNLTETMAITQNLCNAQNFDVVCAELKFDDDEMFENFQKKLSSLYPDIRWPSKMIMKGFRK